MNMHLTLIIYFKTNIEDMTFGNVVPFMKPSIVKVRTSQVRDNCYNKKWLFAILSG